MSFAIAQQQTTDEISHRNETTPVPVVFQESLEVSQVLRIKREQISDDVTIFDDVDMGFDDSNRGFDGTINDPVLEQVVPHSGVFYDNFRQTTFIDTGTTFGTSGLSFPISLAGSPTTATQDLTEGYFQGDGDVVSQSIYMGSEIPNNVSFVSSVLIGSSESVTFYISEDGGTNWTEIVSDSTESSTRQFVTASFTLSNPTDVRWKASLTGSKIYNVKFKFT